MKADLVNAIIPSSIAFSLTLISTTTKKSPLKYHLCAGQFLGDIKAPDGRMCLIRNLYHNDS